MRHHGPLSRLGCAGVRRLTALAAGLAVAGLAASGLPAQDGRDRLQQEQVEILRKAERLRDLMQRLIQRYELEDRRDQVELLRAGLEHLAASAILDTAADARRQLESDAIATALRRQQEIVAGLEQLLNILLERQSVEALEEQIEKMARAAQTAGELAERQADLQRETRATRDDAGADAERALDERLGEIARDARQAARENERQAGLRRPTLEAALQAIAELLAAQGRLETTTERELSSAPDPDRDRAFRLGQLEQSQRDAMTRRAVQRNYERMRDDARALGTALGDDDADALRRTLDRLRIELGEAARSGAARDEDAGGDDAERIADQLERLDALAEKASGDIGQEERDALRGLGKEIEQSAEELAARTGQQADQAQRDGEREATALAGELERSAGEQGRETAASRALREAIEAMKRALAAGERRDSNDATAAASDALRDLSRARERFRDANPDAQRRAGEMATRAEQTANALRNAPQPGEAEDRAADAVDRAEQALRDVAEQFRRDDAGEQPADPDAVGEATRRSREGLEQARDALQQALEQETSERGGALQAARDAWQQIRERTEQLARDLGGAADRGDVTPEQAQGMQSGIEQAQDAMQKADESLSRSRQAQAAQQQRQAADALDAARDALRDNRPMTDAEREAMRDLADEQKQLEEDILRLAELLEKDRNQPAKDALDDAAEAARKAAEAMEQGERDEADRQQQRARDKLEQAQDELEEERDRYMDLRQEELLFRIKDELQQFLDAQKPITQATLDAQRRLGESGRLSRPARRELNALGDREGELAARIAFIHQALAEEQIEVFSHVLRGIEVDLNDVQTRLAGRNPDPGEFTTLLQREVEERTAQLLAALEREQRRREEERQQGQQGSNGGNQFDNQRQRLVRIEAELKMLKQMELDAQRRTAELQRLVEAIGADGISEVEAAMAERLANQHHALTEIFLRLKAQVEQALQPPGEAPAEGRDEEKKR